MLKKSEVNCFLHVALSGLNKTYITYIALMAGQITNTLYLSLQAGFNKFASKYRKSIS